MKLLLDTHALLWWLLDAKRLPSGAVEAVRNEGNEALVSAVSAFELTLKHRIGKLPQAAEIVRGFDGMMIEEGFTSLPVSLTHAQVAGSLPIPHKIRSTAC